MDGLAARNSNITAQLQKWRDERLANGGADPNDYGSFRRYLHEHAIPDTGDEEPTDFAIDWTPEPQAAEVDDHDVAYVAAAVAREDGTSGRVPESGGIGVPAVDHSAGQPVTSAEASFPSVLPSTAPQRAVDSATGHPAQPDRTSNQFTGQPRTVDSATGKPIQTGRTTAPATVQTTVQPGRVNDPATGQPTRTDSPSFPPAPTSAPYGADAARPNESVDPAAGQPARNIDPATGQTTSTVNQDRAEGDRGQGDRLI